MLDQNLFDIDPHDIHKARVMLAIMDGIVRHRDQVDLTMMDGSFTYDRAEEAAQKEVVEVEVTNPALQEAIDIAQLNLLVVDELHGDFYPVCKRPDQPDHDPDVDALRFAPYHVRKAFSGLPDQGYEFARPARAIHWKKDVQTYWIQWTLKDDAAVLWAYDPDAGKAVEVLQVRDK